MSNLLVIPHGRLTDSNNAIIPNGRIYAFVTETLTPATLYTTAELDTPHGAYAEANSAGLPPPIYLDPAVSYRIQVRAAPYSAAVSGMDWDPVTAETAADIMFTPSGSGAVSRTVQAKLRERVTPEDFGAVGDGSTDDIDAFRAALDALPEGGTLYLSNGKTYFLTESLVLEKTIKIIGGGMESDSKLLFAADGTYAEIDTDMYAAIVVLHNLTVLAGYSGDARRSVFKDFTVELEAGATDDIKGMVFSAPCYCYQVMSTKFTSDGFAVIAGAASPLLGNANGSGFIFCASYDNGGHGYHFLGNDANACLVLRSYAAGCDGYGFYDDSLLGNNFDSVEVEDNGDGGYFSNPAKPTRNLFLGTYAETGETYSLSNRDLILNPKGEATLITGCYIMGLVGGYWYANRPLMIASTPDIANSNGDAPNAGVNVSLGAGFLDLKPISDGLHVKWGASGSTYVDLTNGANIIARLPKAAGSGNIAVDRFLFPQGFAIGTGISAYTGSGTAAPASGTHAKGARWLNDNPSVDGNNMVLDHWVCTVAGSPGTWVAQYMSTVSPAT